jgi:TonB family protein
MDDFFIYILKACLGITLFVVPYFFLLRNDSALHLKRFFLLGGVFASFLFPFLTLKRPVVVDVYTPTVGVEPGFVAPQMETMPVEVATGIDIHWPTVLLAIYLCGLLILLFRNVFMLLKWNAVWKKAARKGTGIAYSLNDEIFAMFSRIFLPDRLQNTKEVDSILLHEKAHIRQLHFIDLIIVETAMLLTWFNPFTWLLTVMVKENHEHLADRMVLNEGIDPVEYRTQLLNETMGVQVFSLAHPFNRSFVKNRFDMMKQSRSIRSGLLKVAGLLPLILISLGMAVGKVRQGDTVSGKIVFSDTGEPAHGTSVIVKNTTMGTVADEEGNYQLELKERAEVVFSYVGYKTQTYWFNPGEYRFVALERDIVNLSHTVVQSKAAGVNDSPNFQPPLFRGNANWAVGLREYIFNSIGETALSMERLAESGYEIRFTVEADGKVLKAQGSIYHDSIRLPTAELSKFSKDVIKALNSSAPWTPAMKNGEPVSVKLFLRDNFWFPGEKSQKVKTEEKEVFFIVEEMPQFNNGNPAIEFKKFVDQNLQYPKEETSKGISGRVTVQFVVNADGSVSDAVVLNGVSPGLNSEAIRVIESSPPWTPGRQRGKTVAVKFILPVNFTINEQKMIGSTPDTNSGKEVDIISHAKPGKTIVPKPATRPAEEEIFYIVEEMPRFNNGDAATEFRKYIVENLQYPQEEAAMGIGGRIIVQFRVSSDGSVKDAIVVKGVSPGLDKEALRVVESSPAWTPGKQRGQAVNVLFTFPVNFIIQEGRSTSPDSISGNMISRKVKPEFSYTRNRVTAIDNPRYGFTSVSYLKITRIELNKKSTVLYFDVTFRPKWWIRVPENTYIRPDNASKRLYIKSAEGIPLNEKYYMPESGKISYKLHFPPVDKNASYIDYGEEDNSPGIWLIKNIELIER